MRRAILSTAAAVLLATTSLHAQTTPSDVPRMVQPIAPTANPGTMNPGTTNSSKTWEYAGGGQWPQIASNATTQSAPDPTLDKVEALVKSNQNKAAWKLGIEWFLAHRNSPQADRDLFLIADAFYQYGDRVKAFYYLDELMDEHPDSRYYTQALEKQYQIAIEYLNGYKRRFCGIPMFHAYDEAIEMLYRIQQRSPGSQLAEQALLRTANYYYADQQYDFAADTYAAYIRTYPRSPMVPRVKLRYAYSLYAQFRGPKFDAMPVIDAREQLRELAVQYPQLAQEENVPQLLEQIDRNLARKLVWTGDYYRRTNEPKGAAYTFKYVARAYPQTPEAEQAKVALAKLPAWAVASVPDPAITPGYAPSTPQIQPPRSLPAQRGNNSLPIRSAPAGQPIER
jgi:outer membrane assembly lipoprotein YfiO